MNMQTGETYIYTNLMGRETEFTVVETAPYLIIRVGDERPFAVSACEFPSYSVRLVEDDKPERLKA